ncbi:MAG: helix-turn-helix transcriptional regulator [Prevotella sp.]|jgi:putative transcriptional regulator|nr:helix-turn-helix transcriptional regulator [Prevotella sp.]MBP8687641.1 helix-turn-helix transcriptional regulator [Prevotella sp.]MBP9983035.1 helix-turn-helix transcriptional regulator [Prevotella sp.]
MEEQSLNRIRVALAEKNKSNKWLAEQIGVSVITMSRWVNNRMQPSLDQLVKMAKALDIDVTELINRTKE